MEKSQTITELAKALILFHVKVDKVKKDAKNPFFKSAYASLGNILEVIEMPLNESGLTFAQFPSGNYGLTTILMHTSGEFILSEYFMEPAKKDPQGAGSVITYQRRYALSSILGLNVDEDDDANTGTHGGSTPEKAEDSLKPWLNKGSKEFDGAVKKLIAGTTTIPKIREAMKVSKEMETLLNNAVKLNGLGITN